jgi:Ca-activated chloride channel family protein
MKKSFDIQPNSFQDLHITSMDGFCAFDDINQAEDYVSQGMIPSKEQIHGGLFAKHFFDINPQLEPVEQLFETKLFSSRLYDPIQEKYERILVVGMTSSADGQNQRQKTDFVLVLDRSGSMSDRTFNGINSLEGSSVSSQTKMNLAIEATKQIFNRIEDDEEVGIIVFDDVVDILQSLQPKQTINELSLINKLNTITARGGTNLYLALSTAISLFVNSSNQNRNKRIIFLTDACPTVGRGPDSIRDISEEAFVKSNGHLGISYGGIGLSFDTHTSLELSRVHSTTIFTVNNSIELQEMLDKRFNYLVSPIAFDVKINLSSPDYQISKVYGGDDDILTGDSLIECRTMIGSSVGAEGIRGSILIIHLNPKDEIANKDLIQQSLVTVTISGRPYGNEKAESHDHQYILHDEPNPVTEKAFALSIYYETLRSIFPNQGIMKNHFTDEEEQKLRKLAAFLQDQRTEIRERLPDELTMVDTLIANHCKAVD